jgi:hypothetical protein
MTWGQAIGYLFGSFMLGAVTGLAWKWIFKMWEQFCSL